jgi:hypothetical protein
MNTNVTSKPNALQTLNRRLALALAVARINAQDRLPNFPIPFVHFSQSPIHHL